MKPLDRDKIIALCLKLLENNKKMCKMPLSYFIEVLERAGKNWLNPDYHYRKKAIQVLAFITGQSPPLIEEEMNIGFKLWNKDILYQILEKEIGIPDSLDGFVPLGNLKLRRWPYGLVIFNVSGNVFMVSPFMLAIGLLTKNCILMRVSSREPYFAGYLLDSLIEIAPEIENFLKVAYWKRNAWEDFLPKLPAHRIVLFHLGGEASCRYFREITARLNIHSIIHGPAWGLIVLEEAKKEFAYDIAYDIVLWEQRACHSPRLVFVKGDYQAFASLLAEALEGLNQRFPKIFSEATTINHLLARQKFLVSSQVKLYAPPDTSYTVVSSSNRPRKKDFSHLTDRFIWVSPITKLDEVIDYLEQEDLIPYLQTVAYDGRDENFIRRITSLGASRLTSPGKMNQFLPGASHDGVYNLNLLTKLSTIQ